MMQLSIRWKLAGTYFLIILLILAGTNLFLYRTLKLNYLEARKATVLGNANIIATTGKETILKGDRSTYYLARSFGNQMEARVLILDDRGRVMVDSFGETWLENRLLQHDEVQAALKGRAAAGDHVLTDGQWVLYAAVPVTSKVNGAAGVVMLVTELEDVRASLTEIRDRMAAAALSSGFLAVLVSLGLAGLLTRPVNELKRAVERMAQGHLGERVPVRSRDEIGELAAAFNAMSVEVARVDRMRREFLANVSHELKSPLSSIKALAQSLLDGREENVAVYREFLRDIDLEIDRLTRLVNDMLEMTRLEHDDRPLPRSEEDIADLLEHITALFRARAANLGIQLRVAVKRALRWPVNRDLLSLVLVNLLENALRYTPPGGEVTLSAAEYQGAIAITVRDSGSGIPPEELPKIFERFYRVDKARSRETGGTGLGLAIVHRAVRRMGGKIEVTSTPGKGTRFTITLPGL
jgi:signal transduction histidine kinase